MEGLRSILAVDAGSTTTKAVLIEERDGGYRLTATADAPTTVERPQEDVMLGVLAAVRRLEEHAGRPLLEDGDLAVPHRGDRGVDLFVATSSAGGGLQMLVTGLINMLTAESAQRAALGAGAIVQDVISLDDGRLVVERVARIRSMRPDIILLAGGTDEGNPSHVLALAEYIAAARPRARMGRDVRVPVIFAGNQQARNMVERVLAEEVLLSMTANIRPTLEEENLEPVRVEIHRLFLDHVMAHAPGYDRLLEWSGEHIMPTPAAVSEVMQIMAREYDVNIAGVDIGGATTDVFSIFAGRFHRSVSANLGMSYSMGNVFVQATPANIQRWLPFEYGELPLRNWNFNKMLRPTTLPETLDELLLEQAVGREALRLSFEHHKTVAVELKGVQLKRSYDDALTQRGTGRTLVQEGRMDVLIGSGGLLSHAPRRAQAALMLLDAVQPYGITRLYVDSGFMMPHLGVLSRVQRDIASEVLIKDCLVPLGTCIAPGVSGPEGRVVAQARVHLPGGEVQQVDLALGTLQVIPLERDQVARVELYPRGGVDFGAGRGRRVDADVQGGVVGLILDARGRPITFPRDGDARRLLLREWLKAAGAYSAGELSRLDTRAAEEGS